MGHNFTPLINPFCLIKVPVIDFFLGGGDYNRFNKYNKIYNFAGNVSRARWGGGSTFQ